MYKRQVQGAGSAQEIIRGIQWLNERDGVDVLIVGRGGGSMEDLFEFNDEALALSLIHIYRWMWDSAPMFWTDALNPRE